MYLRHALVALVQQFVGNAIELMCGIGWQYSLIPHIALQSHLVAHIARIQLAIGVRSGFSSGVKGQIKNEIK